MYFHFNEEEEKLYLSSLVQVNKTLQEKLNLINKYNLSGGAFWEKDRETSNIWKITKETQNIK